MIREEQSVNDKYFMVYGNNKLRLKLDYSSKSLNMAKALLPEEAALLLNNIVNTELSKTNEKQQVLSFDSLDSKLSSDFKDIFGKTEYQIKTIERSKINNKVEESKFFCKEMAYPLLKTIRKSLMKNDRDANVHLDLRLLLVSIQVKFRGFPEYEYVIQVKNSAIEPVLAVRASSLHNSIEIRPNLHNTSLYKITSEQIVKDFMEGYQQFLYLRGAIR